MKVTILTTIILAASSFAMAQTTPQVGAQAPAVSLTSNEGRPVSLNDYKGKWVVLYFYPSAIILGVSVDNAESHKQFCAKEGLNFKLLADTDTKVSEAYGSLKDYDGKKMSARNTFIINPEGKIAKVFTGVKPQTHSDEVLQALAELKKS
jgi:peroxiredoxin Q/BCP